MTLSERYEAACAKAARLYAAGKDTTAIDAEVDWLLQLLDQPEPEYEPWRHGGWYTNASYPSGACGCVSRNYPDRKWRIVCDSREGSWPGGPNDHTYANRDEAARAESALLATGVLGA